MRRFFRKLVELQPQLLFAQLLNLFLSDQREEPIMQELNLPGMLTWGLVFDPMEGSGWTVSNESGLPAIGGTASRR